MSFNLKEFLSKRSNYEGVAGYAMGQTRAMQNCTRAMLSKGKSGHEAWEACWDEYQKDGNKIDWIGRYASADVSVVKTAEVKTDLVKTSSFAGLDVSGHNAGSLIFFMAQHGYKGSESAHAGKRTTSFTNGEETLVVDQDEGKLVKKEQ